MPLRSSGERAAASLEQLREGFADSDEAVREAAAWALTQQPHLVPASVSLLKAALSDRDAVVRGLAGIALRNCACGQPLLAELAVRVNDGDANVRIAACDAIAKLGEKGARAVDALIRAAQLPNEHPHVLRSVASALAAIGPSAAPALPVLEQMRQHIRVRWAAETAIARIRGLKLPEGPEPGGVRLQ